MEKMREACKHGNKDQLEVLVQVRNDEGWTTAVAVEAVSHWI